MIDEVDALDTGALFSPCRRWRYLLWRRWDRDKPVCVFVGLNPSTADETVDDPTVRRMKRYAADWGYGSLWVLNAYAFRATDPAKMKAQGSNAVGPRNNEYLRTAAQQADIVVAAWGVHCDDVRQSAVQREVAAVHCDLHALGFTNNGRPRHPLYLKAELKPTLWVASYQGNPVMHVADLPFRIAAPIASS
jgi:hypothetical protein